MTENPYTRKPSEPAICSRQRLRRSRVIALLGISAVGFVTTGIGTSGTWAATKNTTKKAPAKTKTTAAPKSTSAKAAASAANSKTSSKAVATKAPAKPRIAKTAIVVPSTPEQYFVLYVRPDPSRLLSTAEVPVAIVRGQEGTTTITDGRTALPEAHYRVETLSVAKPGDVDGDGIDDLTELADPKNANPLNSAPAMKIETGAVFIPDKATYELLSYQGDDVARDAYLAGLEFVKFWIVDTDKPNPSVYFMNTEAYKAHPMFASVVGIPGGRGPAPGKMRGDIVYTPTATAPDGTKGRYRFAFQPFDAYPFADIALAYELLVTNMPSLAGKLMYYPFPDSALPLYEQEKALYDAYRVPILIE